MFRLTSINLENRFFATICPAGRKFRRILLVYNLLKTRQIRFSRHFVIFI